MVELNVCLLFNFTEYWGIILLNTASVWRPVCSLRLKICRWSSKLFSPSHHLFDRSWPSGHQVNPPDCEESPHHRMVPPPLAAAAWSPSSPIGRISTTLAKRLVVHLAAITTRGPDFDAFATSLAGATPCTVKYICNCQIWNTSPHSQYNSTLKLSWAKVEHNM